MVDTENPRQNVTFASNGHEAHGYLALPPSGTGPGVVVIQEWWGLTTHVADVTDRLAAEGFVALAPDLFGGATTHDAEEARVLMQKMPVDGAARDLGGAVDYLLANDAVVGDRVGAVGFCMGGGFVLILAAQQGDKVAAAVPFYGAPQIPDLSFAGLKADVLGHYAELDKGITPDRVADLSARIGRESGKRPEIHMYPADHAFFNDERPVYDPESAALAWGRTLSFLHQRLG